MPGLYTLIFRQKDNTRTGSAGAQGSLLVISGRNFKKDSGEWFSKSASSIHPWKLRRLGPGQETEEFGWDQITEWVGALGVGRGIFSVSDDGRQGSRTIPCQHCSWTKIFSEFQFSPKTLTLPPLYEGFQQTMTSWLPKTSKKKKWAKSKKSSLTKRLNIKVRAEIIYRKQHIQRRKDSHETTGAYK